MKTTQFFSLTTAFLLATLGFAGIANADMNAQSIVNQFNAASGGSTMQFSYGSNYEIKLTQRAGYGFADTSAYANGVTGGSNYYHTFCVEPTQGVSTNMSATLNYANNKSTTTSGHSLSVGAAYLYSQFAAGTLSGYTYTASSARSTSNSYLRDAIRGLMGVSTMNWNNTFANVLLQINSDKSFWSQTYNPNTYYDVIGNYSVFVMTSYNSGGGAGQDFLYVAKANPSSDVPEPASVLLWGLGSFGVLAARRRAKQRRRQLA